MTNTNADIKGVWAIVAVGKDSLLEIRAIWPKGVGDSRPPKITCFYVPDYGSIDECKAAFEDKALKLNSYGYNIYTVMNPIRPKMVNGSAKDADIRYRDLMLVDIDRVGDTSRPASQAELNAAEELSQDIRAYLGEQGWPDPIVMMSGNGYHLYYELMGVDNNDEASKLVQATLGNLAFKFDNDVVGIDTSVFNASRITKVPGTVARKGVESEGRCYRVARVI